MDLRLTLEFFSKFVDKVFLTSYLMVNTKKWVKVTVCGLLREINILLKVGCFIFSVFSSITARGSLYFVLVFVAFHFFRLIPDQRKELQALITFTFLVSKCSIARTYAKVFKLALNLELIDGSNS